MSSELSYSRIAAGAEKNVLAKGLMLTLHIGMGQNIGL